MGKIVHQPFDKLVKSTLHNVERAREFLQAHLPDSTRKYVDLDRHLQLVNKEFIKGNQKELRCDILYRTHIKDYEGYIYSHIEAQSTPEELMPIRMLTYNLELIIWHWENVKKEIPPIINLILYNGTQSPYPYEINIADFLKKHEVIGGFLFESNVLIDLMLHTDTEIEKHEKIALMELLLKHSKQRDFYNRLEKLKKEGKFKLFLSGEDRSYSEAILLFVADILDSNSHKAKQILDLFTGISTQTDEDTMTVLQSIKQEGRQEGIKAGRQEGIKAGRQEGKKEGVLEIAKNLFACGASLDLIRKTTGLSDTELAKLSKR